MNTFQRYEQKYLINPEQQTLLLQAAEEHLVADKHGSNNIFDLSGNSVLQQAGYLVQNIYYDSDTWQSIRASIDKPQYKEKLRLRCYGRLNTDGKVYLELKKKFKGVVYKRRLAIAATSLTSQSIQEILQSDNSQIAQELAYYLSSHTVFARVYISYQRLAYTDPSLSGFRLTFDSSIRFRLFDLNFVHPNEGQLLVPSDQTLMEVKTLTGIPLWLSALLSEDAVYPNSFSKIGFCYSQHIQKVTSLESVSTVLSPYEKHTNQRMKGR